MNYIVANNIKPELPVINFPVKNHAIMSFTISIVIIHNGIMVLDFYYLSEGGQNW